MNLTVAYLFLTLAVFLGVTSNSFAKSAEGFTLIVPSIITSVTIILCMYALSMVMKIIPMGITYASFAGLAIIATAAKEPPSDKEPVSPINILAGGALYQRNPRHEPTMEPQKIDSSPTSGIYCSFKYSAKIVLPTT